MRHLLFVFLYDLLQILRTDVPFDMDEIAIVARGVEYDFSDVVFLNLEEYFRPFISLVAGDDRLESRILKI